MTTILDLDQAAACLHAGGVIAYPTEAVWGLGCDPNDQAAVARLLAIKRRTQDKGLILIAADIDQLTPFIDLAVLPQEMRERLSADWPGPDTWVVPKSATTPAWIVGAHDGVAVRVSAHPPVVALCDAFGGALVSTSANPAGAPPPRQLDEFDPTLLAALDGLVSGDIGEEPRPSTIRDARSGAVLRA